MAGFPKKGYTLVEILLASGLILVFMGALIFLLQGASRQSRHAEETIQANKTTALLLAHLKKDLRSSSRVRTREQEIMLDVNRLNQEQKIEVLEVAFTAKNGKIVRKTSEDEETVFDYANVLHEGETLHFAVNKSAKGTALVQIHLLNAKKEKFFSQEEAVLLESMKEQ